MKCRKLAIVILASCVAAAAQTTDSQSEKDKTPAKPAAAQSDNDKSQAKAAAPSGNEKAPAKPEASSDSNAAPPSATDDPSYTIGPEDMLHVNVWKEQELSGQVQVRPDGKISLPLINDVQAVGMTPMALAQDLTERLKKYVAEPRVTVTVAAINSRRIYMVGNIKAGAFPLTPNMTVMQALSAAGCCTEFANTKKIYVLRNENGKQVKYPFNFKEAMKGTNEKQNILLKPGDTIVVP